MTDFSKDVLYLSAPVNSLLKGYYRQDTTIGELKSCGDFGLGTFNNLDGEMVMIDGLVYQLSTDGYTYPVADGTKTPFAAVTFFSPQIMEEFEGDFDNEAFHSILEKLILSPNMLFAIRIDGEFDYVKVWSVSKQENYKQLTESEGERPVFEFTGMEGILAGFYVPRFIKSLCMPGFHLHFLTADKKRGGHLHECRLKKMKITMQVLPRLTLNLPITIDYLTASLPR
ncbi:MAG: acetolactate decarboxylase [Syntrophaceae bacterium]